MAKNRFRRFRKKDSGWLFGSFFENLFFTRTLKMAQFKFIQLTLFAKRIKIFPLVFEAFVMHLFHLDYFRGEPYYRDHACLIVCWGLGVIHHEQANEIFLQNQSRPLTHFLISAFCNHWFCKLSKQWSHLLIHRIY